MDEVMWEGYGYLFDELSFLRGILVQISKEDEEPVSSARAHIALLDHNRRVKNILSELEDAELAETACKSPAGDA